MARIAKIEQSVRSACGNGVVGGNGRDYQPCRIALPRTDVDAELARWDRAAGIDGPAIIAWAADHPFFSSLLAITYLSSFHLLFGLTVLLAFMRRFDQLWVLAFVFAATIVVSTSFSVVWPAKGAFAFFDYPASLLERLPQEAGIYHLEKFDYFRSDVSPVLSFASLQGVVTFPSFHCCLALMTIFTTWGLRSLFAISLGWNALVARTSLAPAPKLFPKSSGSTLSTLFGSFRSRKRTSRGRLVNGSSRLPDSR